MEFEQPRNLLTQWCRLWIRCLVEAGVQRFVVCPGSRNTPLVAAIEDCRGIVSGIECFLNIDERSAAFFALGQAKYSGQASAVVCTSGSAAAHFFPAIIEADRSQTPLLLLSADRPLELHGNASAQTTDQTRLFGEKVRGFFDLGAPDASSLSLRALRRKAAQAVALAHFPNPGPVHVNVPARKPLEPLEALTEAERALAAESAALAARPVRVFAPLTRPSAEAVAAVTRRIAAAQRPLLSVGPCAPHAALEPALLQPFVDAGWAIIGELPSQVRRSAFATLAAADSVLAMLCSPKLRREYVPDLCLHLGAPLTSSNWERLFERVDAPELILAHATDWPDPGNRASMLLQSPAAELLTMLAPTLPRLELDFGQRLLTLNAGAERGIQASATLNEAPFNEFQAVAVLGKYLDKSSLLVLGNSLPIRIADSVLQHCPGPCLCQRGANGIDGLLSLAAGAATQHAGRTYLLLGDVSTLHDLSGLDGLSRAHPRLTVLILNNNGGRIFETLPVAAREPLNAWTTPHQIQLDALGPIFGLKSHAVTTPEQLSQVLAASAAEPGPVWIEARFAASAAKHYYANLGSELRAVVAKNFSSDAE